MTTAKRTYTKRTTDENRGPASPTMKKILDLMVQYGDARGNLHIKQLDERSPGWERAHGLDRQKTAQGMYYYRKSGAFQRYQAQLGTKGAGTVQKAGPVADQASEPGAAGFDAQQIERLVNERAAEQMQQLVTETRFCSRCGKDRLPQIRAEMLQAKL